MILAAAPYERLVERSRQIGARPDLVVHGGGNTSTKTTGTDHLGRSRPILVVKASGADLRSIDATGFVELYLDELLAALARTEMSDDEMMAFVARCHVRPSIRRASIETLLHAFIPGTDVDHVHADVICAITKSPDPRGVVRDALGPDVAYVPYMRPGFALAKHVAGLRDAEAVVLGHHGLVTWTHDGNSLDRTIEVIARAERYLGTRRRGQRSAAPPLPAEGTEPLLIALRSRLSRDGRLVLHVERSARTIADRPDADDIAVAGPATADHLLTTRPWSVVVRGASDVPGAVEAYEARYRSYWERHKDRAPEGYGMRSPLPRVVIVPGLGVVAAGRTKAEARRTAEVAAHTHAVAATAIDAFGSCSVLDEQDVFDIDHWPLELAKLGVAEARELAGRAFLVTGAASGIGRATALALAREGAHIVAADIDQVGLDALDEELSTVGPEASVVRADVTDEAAVDRLVTVAVGDFGGLDGAVSNAGIAAVGRISEVPVSTWERSLDVNLTAHFLVARRVLRTLADQGLGGSIVFVASKNAFDPGAGFGPYSVAKAAEVQLARMVAIEGGPIGVRANVVSPDAVFAGSALWSDELRRSRAAAHGVAVEDLERFYVGRNLLRREVRAEDVAEAVVFLLSERSSRTTGSVITVDGGLSAAFPR